MKPNPDSILDTIGKLVGKTKEELRPEAELVADLGIDSPKSLELLVALEDAYGIEISDEAAAKMETVGDVLAFYAGE